MPLGRIDTHQHIVPDFYRAWLTRRGILSGGKAIPAWSLDDALGFMDAHNIAGAVLSVSTPGPHSPDRAETRDMARQLNAYCAALCKQRPTQFGFLASLTLPDMDGAIAEARYAFDHLAADGVVLMTNVDGVYVGDLRWDPLLAELDQRHAVVLLHPSHLPAAPAEGIEPFVADFLLDTVRAAITIAKADCFRRFPNIKFILSHGGGFVPFAAARVARACTPDGDLDAGVRRLQQFYLDTALAAGPYALPSLLAFADPARLLFGTDRPFAATERASWFTTALDAYPLASDLRHAISRRNAEAIYPRFARPTAAH